MLPTPPLPSSTSSTTSPFSTTATATMAPPSSTGGQQQRRRQRPARQLNLAFASAHGLSQQPLRQRQPLSSSTSTRTRSNTKNNDNGCQQKSQPNKVDAALRTARSTGRLNLSDCSLTTLPSAMFDLRHHIEIDLSMDSTSNPGAWQSYGEEEVTTLDLSDNPLSAKSNGVDERFEKFVSLKTLRMKRCNLVELSWCTVVSKFDNLLVLDVSGNDLTEAYLEYLPTMIREVDLSSNKITRLTEPLVHDGIDGPTVVLPYLVRLDISNNQLREFPSAEVPSLQTLSFGNNRIEELPSDLIDQCSNSLTTLEGSRNQLRIVPNLFDCKRLTVLDLSDNALHDIPSVSPKVVRMNLNNNALTSVSGLFSGVQHQSDTFRSELTELCLRGNKLSELDGDVIRCLTKLTLLDIGQNDLTDVPAVLGYLPDLRSIPLDGNSLRKIRTELAFNTSALKDFLRKRGPAPPGPGYMAGMPCRTNNTMGSPDRSRSLVSSALTAPFILDLKSSHLDGLPLSIQNELLSSSVSGNGDTAGALIKKLVLSKNSLEQIDDWLQAMPNLTSVDAAQNQVDCLPECIGNLSLTELRLPRNKLAAVSVCCLGEKASSLAMNLTCLDLSGNHLEWFPSCLAKLPVLSALLLSDNSIQTLAIGMEDGEACGWREGFKALETLDLSGNKISDLGEMPRCLIECCPLIRSLPLSNNELAAIPPTLGVLESLNSIDLRGNPQRGIRTGILDRSTPEILTYLRSRIDAAELRTMQDGRAGSSSAHAKDSKLEESNAESSQKLEELKKDIQDLTLELNNVHLTEAKKWAMKKSLKILKASLIKEERRIRTEAAK